MKKRINTILSVLALSTIIVSSPVNTFAATTINNEINGKDYKEEFKEVPKRAVSLAGFTTEILLSLGVGNDIAGYAYQDNPVLPEYKSEFDKLKELSKTNPSQEVFLSVKPDFVTGWASTFSKKNFPVDFLDANKIKFYMPRVEYDKVITMDTVYEDYENLGKIFAVEDKAKSEIDKMKKSIEDTENKVKDRKKVKVFIYDSGEDAPFTASAALPTDMIKKAGGENIFAGDKKLWMNVSWEQVVEKNPDFIIINKYDASDDDNKKKEFLLNNPALKNVNAIKNGNIFVVGLSDILAGPRDAATIEMLAKKFHPEAFK